MDTSELKYLFQNKYSRENWIKLLLNIFPKSNFQRKPDKLQINSDYVKDCYELGSFKTPDDSIIGIFEVSLSGNVQIERNRVGLRNILRPFYNQIDGAFAVFYQGNKWRFSFISETRIKDESGNWIESKTEPKRYTYVLGIEETIITAAQRFEILLKSEKSLKDITDAFSVEKLSKEFFKSYKEYFEKFTNFISNNSHYRSTIFNLNSKRKADKFPDDEKAIRDFVKLLLGRLIFLYFLQKKGWLGCPNNIKNWENGDIKFLFNLFKNYKDKEHFHSKCLSELFFNTLNNNNRINDIFDITNTRIPYLNGGLFDNNNSLTQTIDFPPDYFSMLFCFFDEYNFTIDENSADDFEIGIDPEMLGHIFENLLEENREKGAFYTPKEIVHYMCRESILEYLKNNLGNNEELENFVRNDILGDVKSKKNFIINNARKIKELLNNIKVCDPAIGSGAFPMGILMEILRIKSNLDYTLDRGKEKKFIIQNNIYGVDIDSGAIDIARLRFWLSLIVDEDFPEPLPNLDYKFMQGNSLLESFEDIDLSKSAILEEPSVRVVDTQEDIFNVIKDAQTKYVFSDEDRSNIKSLIDNYYKITDKDKKDKIRKTIDTLVLDHINASLEFFENRINIDIKSLKNNIKSDVKGLKPNHKELYIKNCKETKQILKKQELLKKNSEARRKLIDFEKTSFRPYFLWHLYFKDVFVNGGFDIIIGNPPYIQLQKDGGKLADLYKDCNFSTFERTGDIYSLFYEKGINLLKKEGHLCFVTSNKWMRAGYGDSLRELFVSNNPKMLIDLGPGVFENATVDVNILIIQKFDNNNSIKGVTINKEAKGKDLNEFINKNLIPLPKLSRNSWYIGDFFEQNLKEKIERLGKPLREWDVNIFYGIKTGLNEAFVIDNQTKEKLCKEDPKNIDIIKPLLRGRDIKRFLYEWHGLWLIFIPWHFPMHKDNSIQGASLKAEKLFKEQYKTVYNHLLQYKEKLKNRNHSETGIHYEWYVLQRCANTYYQEFDVEKIIYPNMSDNFCAVFDDQKFYINQKCFIMTGKSLKYITGFLNSNLNNYYFRQIGAKLGNKGLEMSKIFVENIPIPEITVNNKNVIQQIENLVAKIISLKKDNHIKDTTNYEYEIDQLVYKLYDLSDNEIKIIENN